MYVSRHFLFSSHFFSNVLWEHSCVITWTTKEKNRGKLSSLSILMRIVSHHHLSTPSDRTNNTFHLTTSSIIKHSKPRGFFSPCLWRCFMINSKKLLMQMFVFPHEPLNTSKRHYTCMCIILEWKWTMTIAWCF